MWGKSMQMFTIIKYQKKFSMYLPVGNTVYSQVKTTTLKCFWKNGNTFPKEKEMTTHVTDDIEIYSQNSDKEDF